MMMIVQIEIARRMNVHKVKVLVQVRLFSQIRRKHMTRMKSDVSETRSMHCLFE